MAHFGKKSRVCPERRTSMNDSSKATMDEMITFFDKLAEITALLFEEEPASIMQIDPGRANTLGVLGQMYISAVQLKNAMTMLFTTGARGLPAGTSVLVVTEAGDVDTKVMRAISFRFGTDMSISPFSRPLARELRQRIASGRIAASPSWKLRTGEGQSIYLEAIREKEVQAPRPPRKRAKSVKFRCQNDS